MILGKGWQVIMSAAGDTDKGNFPGIQGLQFFTVADGQQPVFGAMQNISMAIYFGYPFIGTHMKPKHKTNGQYGQKTFHRFFKTEVWSI